MTTDIRDDDALEEAREKVRLRQAFLEASAKILPSVVWREPPSDGLKYPHSSPVLGSLAIAFDDAEITVYFKPEISHWHFTPSYGTDDHDKEYGRVATKALAFINELVSDRIVLRWGPRTGGTYSERWLQTPLGRLWRLMTPRAQEAVWSGKKLA